MRTETRTVYVVEWERDWHPSAAEDDCSLRCRSRQHYFSKHGAYRALARKLIFQKRDALEEGGGLCPLCEPDEEGIGQVDGCYYGRRTGERCRYHGGDGWDRLVTRLARWLLWRDRRRAEP